MAGLSHQMAPQCNIENDAFVQSESQRRRFNIQYSRYKLCKATAEVLLML